MAAMIGREAGRRRRLRRGDRRLLLFVFANTLCLAGFASTQLSGPAHGASRPIDVEAVEAKIRDGDLVRHEALWYHVEEDED